MVSNYVKSQDPAHPFARCDVFVELGDGRWEWLLGEAVPEYVAMEAAVAHQRMGRKTRVERCERPKRPKRPKLVSEPLGIRAPTFGSRKRKK